MKSRSNRNGSVSVTYTVSYDGANGTTVTLSTNDIMLNKTGTANGIVSVSGSGNTRTITLSNLRARDLNHCHECDRICDTPERRDRSARDGH